jgi:hypothetical protein
MRLSGLTLSGSRETMRRQLGDEPFTSDVAEVFTVGNDKIHSFDIVFDSAPYPS